ncbi:DUF72 domain-containing protein [Sphingomonas xinjiangensis]|uniref:Uncharacterized protein YecE (DUF72 family) n=1 Tax=Sphingomonas xinjiangensis TaxID=643568 RepID=A0A840YQB3_9SPHN|nr:DUF72 domain-containing protein [Sphingomonas xinjiangensis]MBB5710702.1 uncharacterized protein YecE (DUF72 family) [Sphingomonas xinjiangensis]
MATHFRIGTAAWALPRTVREHFPEGASNLARYAGRFDAVEINTSFYRPHRHGSYARWAAAVGEDFRFSVKLPKAISHEAKLKDCGAQLAEFFAQTSGLGVKLGAVLLQLPPKLAFDAGLALRFLRDFREASHVQLVCEPRHPSWFDPDADALLREHRVARVAADPARVPEAARPGGWRELAYFRLHGSPRTYWSSYEPAALDGWAAAACAAEASQRWVIFDNTASGAATENALSLLAQSEVR